MSAVAEAAWPHCSRGNSGTDFTTTAAVLPQAGPTSTVCLVLCDCVLPVALMEHASLPVQAHTTLKPWAGWCQCSAAPELCPLSAAGYPYMSQAGDREISPLFRLLCCSSGSMEQIPKLTRLFPAAVTLVAPLQPPWHRREGKPGLGALCGVTPPTGALSLLAGTSLSF